MFVTPSNVCDTFKQQAFFVRLMPSFNLIISFAERLRWIGWTIWSKCDLRWTRPHKSVVWFGNKTRVLRKICTMIGWSFIHINGSNIPSWIQLVLKIRTFYRTKNGSRLYLLCLIIGKLNEISKILMVRAHIDKVKSPAFHFYMERSRDQQHFKSILPKQL